MRFERLLLGAAAGIAVIGTAQAADLPMTKGEAVEYVKVCSTFGPGFFYIPGSDTCLKIGGEIRADYRAFGGDSLSMSGNVLTKTKFNRNDNRSAFGTQGRIWFDARTQTDYGLLRSYFQINASGRTASRTGTGTTNSFSVDKAFIQFGGLTAGYAHSFFGFYDNEYGDTIWAPYYAESNTVNLLAYTAQFGGGLSATLSIEDGRDHRSGLALNSYTAGGQQVPDVVGQLRYDGNWGSVAVQAAGHQVRSGGTTAPYGSTYGFAAGGTILIKIPAIDGGHFVVEGQYADGATDYLGAGNSVLGAADQFEKYDTTGALGNFTRGKGFSIVAELGANVTPDLVAALVGSYIDTSYSDALYNTTTDAPVDFKIREFTVAGNLTYTIVKGLTLGGEVSYTRVSAKNALVLDSATDTDVIKKSVDANVWQVGLRLKRSF
ncbi:porin [Labrys okinawensis]|uniref:porin n=1 Tax=Labrys okinawensis TaxID=346911 RepID=UPI0039BD2862